MPVLGNMSTSPECKSDFPLAQEIKRVESPAHRDKVDTKGMWKFMQENLGPQCDIHLFNSW